MIMSGRSIYLTKYFTLHKFHTGTGDPYRHVTSGSCEITYGRFRKFLGCKIRALISHVYHIASSFYHVKSWYDFSQM